ncbi:hypothetical protein [Desertibacillus haloalkaliphilus]|uniref:hypothetical protein n=1 Tax=Desertibacillus haloalkaliphilus TaxID=1328930 RepID=UPI001C2784E5|nr:hypothetical protein [Desertibacillus haloalkaliphilus]MBU8905423.1 hypothetical protein [Desertibacillus haloalkaliphilus]
MSEKKSHPTNGSREDLFMDVDRMINEGLGGGSISMKDDSGEIEEAHDFKKEEPPHRTERS